MKIKWKYEEGQSLVEVVVVTAVVFLLVTGLVSGTTSALRSAQIVRMRSQAIQYAEEGIELTRNQRNTSWSAFQAYSSGSTTPSYWCLNKSGVWSLGNSPPSECAKNIDNLFARGVSFVWRDPRMEVTVTVSWSDGSQTHKTVLSTYFTQWK